jgi:hypothetical protein
MRLRDFSDGFIYAKVVIERFFDIKKSFPVRSCLVDIRIVCHLLFIGFKKLSEAVYFTIIVLLIGLFWALLIL